MNQISILILTKNEEQDLPDCLKSVSWSDDIHVFDSFSSDDTCLIAERHGAKVTKRQFDNWSSHQNWGLSNIKFRYPWVLYIDADERISDELRANIQNSTSLSQSNISAFRIRRRDYFCGRWLKHSQISPFFIRLFRPEKTKYERLVNPVTLVDGNVCDLSGPIIHFPFSKGLSHWLDRHNKYSTLEAVQTTEQTPKNIIFSFKRALFSSHFNTRRAHQKEIFNHLPFRPLIKFFIFYFVRLGFLDGVPGFLYCCLQSYYEFMIILKIKEIKSKF